MADSLGYFCVFVLGFSVVNLALGGSGRGASWRAAGAVAATLLVLVCGVVLALAVWSGRGVVGLYFWALCGVLFAVFANAARVFGVVAWAQENRGRAAAVVVVLVALAAAVVPWSVKPGGGPGVPLAVAAPAVVSVSVPALDPVPLVSAPENVGALPDACLCVDRLVCVGPRGGRYCITDAGKKKYL